MRNVTAAVIVFVFATGLACAQYKTPPQAKPAGPVSISTPTSTAAPAPEQSLDSAKRISREDAIKLVQQNKAVFVDVRSKETYDAEHIKGALSMPLSELMNHLRDVPPGKMIITYCA